MSSIDWGRELREDRIDTGEVGKISTIKKIYNSLMNAWRNHVSCISMQGGTRSGKTYNIMIWIILFCFDHARAKIGITRKTSPTIYGTVFQDFKDIMFRLGHWDDDCMNYTRMEYKFPNGSMINFFPADEAAKLKGRKNDITWLNEATEMTFNDYFQLNNRTSGLLILDYNPDFSEDHWLNQVNEEPTTFHFITTYKDNKFLEKRIIEQIEKLRTTNFSLWMMYGEGKRCKLEGLIFPNIKVIDHFPTRKEIEQMDKAERDELIAMKHAIGIDFGYNDPTAVMHVGVTKNRVYIDELCYQRKMLSEGMKDILMDNEYRNMLKVADSAAREDIERLRSLGVSQLKGANKGGRNKTIIPDIRTLQSKEIYITAHSQNMLKEARNYCFEIDASGEPTDKPAGGMFDHGWDAVRYASMALIGRKKYGRRRIRTNRGVTLK